MQSRFNLNSPICQSHRVYLTLSARNQSNWCFSFVTLCIYTKHYSIHRKQTIHMKYFLTRRKQNIHKKHFLIHRKKSIPKKNFLMFKARHNSTMFSICISFVVLWLQQKLFVLKLWTSYSDTRCNYTNTEEKQFLYSQT